MPVGSGGLPAGFPVLMGSYSSAQRRELADALARGEAPRCPGCGAEVSVRAVPRPESVSYVRRRAWVLCPECRRTGAVDVPDAGGLPD